MIWVKTTIILNFHKSNTQHKGTKFLIPLPRGLLKFIQGLLQEENMAFLSFNSKDQLFVAYRYPCQDHHIKMQCSNQDVLIQDHEW